MSATRPSTRSDDLAARALLGVERGRPGPDVAVAVAELLRDAAMVGLETRAGRRAATVSAFPEPCPEETRPSASGAAQARLGHLLDAGDDELLLEWLRHASVRNLRVADALVPRVLERYERRSDVPAEALPALGTHGPWLARWNPAWRGVFRHDADTHDLDERWSTERAAERSALLMAVRRADPARGRALLDGVWAAERADERVRLLEALRERLSPDDEPLLERTLDDRAKSVRIAAAELLAALPASAFKRRMNDRLAGMVRVARVRSGLLRRERVTVELDPPSDLDPAWVRDGVDPDPPAGVGKRAWWLTQVMGYADPATLTQTSTLQPEAFIEAIEASDFADACVVGLAAAARRSARLEWAVVVSAFALARAAARTPIAQLEDLARYWGTLPREVLEPLALQAFRTEGWRDTALESTLEGLGRFWAPEFSRSLVAALSALRPPQTTSWYGPPLALRQIATRLHPESLDAFERWISALQPSGPYATTVQKTLDGLLTLVRFRSELYKEFFT
ncbi:MAG: hypothetical protein JNM94_14420 [Phycisphaerae bacterium]|nr:hypothetical protein [Phycisphaerae bacterium]